MTRMAAVLGRCGVGVVVACILCSAAGSAAAQPAAGGPREVAIVVSEAMQPYRDAVAGFKEGMQGGPSPISYEEFLASSADPADLARRIRDRRPAMVFAVGTQASVFARRYLTGLPVVFAMVLNPVENGVVPSMRSPGPGVGGVCLNIPIDAQLTVLKRLKPSIGRVGMLYNAKAGSGFAVEAIEAAKRARIDLVALPVNSEHEISPLLRKVLSEADGLWACPDPLIYNASTAQQIILAALQSNKPFMAFSKNFVKAGALAALECDYRDIGRQAGELAAKMMGGQDTAGAVEYPRRTILIINKRTADVLGLRINKEILDAAVVYGAETERM